MKAVTKAALNRTIRQIASHLVGIHKTDLTVAEKNIVRELITAQVLMYVGTNKEVSWR